MLPTPPPESRHRPLGPWGWVVIAAMGALLGAAIWFAFYAWNLLAGVAISANGIIAMVLGVAFATGLGAGLMALLFWSHRKGYDR
jgi:hypothetical protein